jgi:hypothetical protein
LVEHDSSRPPSSDKVKSDDDEQKVPCLDMSSPVTADSIALRLLMPFARERYSSEWLSVRRLTWSRIKSIRFAYTTGMSINLLSVNWASSVSYKKRHGSYPRYDRLKPHQALLTLRNAVNSLLFSCRSRRRARAFAYPCA